MRTIFLLLLSVSLAAQHGTMNAYLVKALRQDLAKDYAILVQGNVAQVKQFTENHQGLFKYNCGDICSVVLKGYDIQQLSKTGIVTRLEYYERTPRPLDDSAIVKNNILKIHAGATPLPQAYDGSGVTFGLVDTGIDWNHPDFKDSISGKTRIRWLWDQNKAVAPNTPQPYNYGQEWDNVQIDSGNCTHDDTYAMGHGTNVAGIAVGNGATGWVYKGHAPKADIICVGLNFSLPGPIVLDAINYLVEKADSMGQPFVLNLSIGDYYGSHDGKDLQAQAIDALFANVPGRCAVAAAGNAGHASWHLRYSLTSDTSLTFIRDTTTATNTFVAYADTASFQQAYFTIGVHDKSGAFNYVGNTGWRNIYPYLGSTLSDTIKNANGDRIGIVETTGGIQAGAYELVFTITADSIGYFWTLETTGQGTFDAWNFSFLNAGLPSSATLPRMIHYKMPDSLQTICTSFQCSPDVITVGDYRSREGHISCQQTWWQMPGPYDTLVHYSSRGPTRDNRMKPDIAATGDNILTTCNLVLCEWMAVNFPSTNQIIAADTMHITFSGTSSSCPAVAGFVALYLQKNPAATSSQILNAIIGCAKQDAFTGSNLPNYAWGYGKLDGYNAMICSSTGLDPASAATVLAYPNPASGSISFSFARAYTGLSIKLYSVIGSEILSAPMPQKNPSIYVGNLPQGLYLYRILSEGTVVGEGKFIKE